MKKTSFTMIVVGSILLVIQNMFYGYVDANGVLRDSLFLPVGMITLMIGVSLLIGSYILNITSKCTH